MKADLHTHTTASDGRMTPKEVVEFASSSGIAALAVTDHDTIDGLDEAITAGREAGIKVIPGIELSAFSVGEIHILGYGFDYKNSWFCEELSKIKNLRRERNLAVGDKLSALGIEPDINFAADGVGRMNIARKLVDGKFVSSVQEAFDKYLGSGGLAYSASKRLLPFEAVKLITDFGGIAVIAHPRKYLLDRRLNSMLSGLKPFGLKGLEVYYPGYSKVDTDALKALASEYGLITTGGSDFHGDDDRRFFFEPDEATVKALKLLD